jgi:glycosyltransferase involved in cell wall biosynthesis
MPPKESLGRNGSSLKVLVCAFACNPLHGSEDGVGWGWVDALARLHEVWVLTAAFHRSALEGVLCRYSEKYSRLHLVYVEEKPWHYRPNAIWDKIERSMLKPVMNWAYRCWLGDAYRVGKELHREISFDLAHQLTFVGFRFPGHLWKLGIPFVWGPIGGLENTPWHLLPTMGAQGAIYYGVRNVVNMMHLRFLRKPREAFAAAGPGVIAATAKIKDEIRRWYGVESQVICEVGLPPQTATDHSKRTGGEPLRIVWSGRHLPGKALHLLLRALSLLPAGGKWQLEIYGDGPFRRKWQRLAVKLEIESRCKWHGHVSRAAALGGLRSAHVFVTTSLKDLTSTVILEALASGVPVICPDHCGFSDVVTSECGIKVPIPALREFEQGLARAISELALDEPRRRCLAASALLRAREYSWEAKALAMDRVYRRTLAAHSATFAKPVPVSTNA